MIQVTTWAELSGGTSGHDAENVALARLREAEWFKHLGEPTTRDRDVDRVGGWSDALTMFSGGGNTRRTGTLTVPKLLLIERLDADDMLNRVTVDAANRALDAIDATPHIPASLAFEDSLSVSDYITEYIRLLSIEIYAGDVGASRCSYFRDQLPWFLAGLLPCGWNGEWPVGRMRVY